MTWQSGGGGGSLPGLTGDGAVPPGIVVAGSAVIGDPNALTDERPSLVHGNVIILDTPATDWNSDDLVDIRQVARVTPTGGGGLGLNVSRGGFIGQGDYQSPIVEFYDNTASAQPAFRVFKGSGYQIQVDGDGVRLHDKIKVGSSIAHVLGAYSGNAVPIYDEAGTLLGYMPLYS